MEMWEQFDIGFWHPFGPYTGLSTDQVLDWKASEVERNGWTFWSFVYSSSADQWLDLLAKAQGPVFALCSHSPGARDPDTHRGTLLATHYRYLRDGAWQAMPDPGIMKVTNPFKRRGLALGFKVGHVVELDPVVPPFGIEWYSKGDQRWRSDRLPPRGEFLIRRGGNVPPRPVCALLELAPPYLAVLKREPESVDV
jgi:hypothetical protein